MRDCVDMANIIARSSGLDARERQAALSTALNLGGMTLTRAMRRREVDGKRYDFCVRAFNLAPCHSTCTSDHSEYQDIMGVL